MNVPEKLTILLYEEKQHFRSALCVIPKYMPAMFCIYGAVKLGFHIGFFFALDYKHCFLRYL